MSRLGRLLDWRVEVALDRSNGTVEADNIRPQPDGRRRWHAPVLRTLSLVDTEAKSTNATEVNGVGPS